MNEIYLKELKSYSKDYLLHLITIESLNKLLEYDIIKKNDNNYKFHFVGLIIIDNDLIKVYPKYIQCIDNIGEDFNQIINVIKKYKKSHEDFIWGNDEVGDILFNKLSLVLFFIEDYFENGFYTKIENSHEINGDGEINWDMTINNFNPIIQNSQVIYGELYTKYKVNDIFDYFRMLHEYIITDCVKILNNLSLIELFNITPLELSDKNIDDFDDKEFILEKLEKELSIEFNSHKQKLLKAMHMYISNKNLFTNENIITIYGTKFYHKIWEDVCSEVFLNQYTKIKGIIKKPIWVLNSGKRHTHPQTFKPDIVTFNNNTLIILDAKYYNLKFNEDLLKNQPGLSDISKQYLYQLSLKDYLDENNFNYVKNAFLFPTYSGVVENKGYIELEILKRLELENIQVIMLPAGKINEFYLKNKKMSVELLNLK